MRRTIALLAATAATVGVLAGCATPAEPLPAGSDEFPTASQPEAPAELPAEPAVEPEEEETPAEAAATTCDVVREAFLTGTATDVKAALAALQKDKTADATAREYADYYLHRDAKDEDLREMDKSLIQMSCG